MKDPVKITQRYPDMGLYGWQTAAAWFTPPIVVPALLILLVIARVVYFAS